MPESRSVLLDLDENLHIDVHSYMNDLIERQHMAGFEDEGTESTHADEESFDRMLNRVRRIAEQCSESHVSAELTALARTMPEYDISRPRSVEDGNPAEPPSAGTGDPDVRDESDAPRPPRARGRHGTLVGRKRAAKRGRHRRGGADGTGVDRSRRARRHAARRRGSSFGMVAGAVVLAALAAVAVCVVVL